LKIKRQVTKVLRESKLRSQRLKKKKKSWLYLGTATGSEGVEFFQENGKKLKQVTYLEKSVIDRREGTEGSKYLCHGKLTECHAFRGNIY
jgi:hypothetical protein